MQARSVAITVSAFICAAAAAQANTFVWVTNYNANASSASAWYGGYVPSTGGADTAEFQNLGGGTNVTVTVDAGWAPAGSLRGVTFQVGDNDPANNGVYTLVPGGGVTSLGIGAGGLTSLDNNGTHVVSLPILFGADCTLKGTLDVTSLLNASTATRTLAKSDGTLTLRGTGGAIGANVTNLVLNSGDLQMLHGAAEGVNTNRIADSIAITANGGRVTLGRMTSTGGTAVEDMGPLTMAGGLCYLDTAAVVDGTGVTTVYRFAGFKTNGLPAAGFFYYPGNSATVRFKDASGFPFHNGIVGGWAVQYTSGQFLAPPGDNANLGVVTGVNRNNTTLMSAAATENTELITDSAFTLTGDLKVNSLRIAVAIGAVTLDLGGHELRIDTGGLMAANTSGTKTIQHGYLTVGAADNSGGTLYLGCAGTSARDFMFASDGLIRDNGTAAVNLVSLSASTVTLSGNSSYRGFTAVLQGTLVASGDGAAGGDNAPLGKVPSIPVADNIRVMGGTLRGPASGTLTIHPNRGIWLGPRGATLGVANTASIVFNGVISGPGSLSLQSPCTFGGTSPNTYAGTTTFGAAGTLTLGKSAGVNAIPGDLIINNQQASIASDRYVTLGANEQIADTAVVTLLRPAVSYTGPGRTYLRLNGYNETIGGLVGTCSYCPGSPVDPLIVENNSASAASQLTVQTAADSFYRYSGRLRDGSSKALSLVVSGAGIQELSGTNNTHTGGTTVNGGTLLVSNRLGVGLGGTGPGSVTVGAAGTLGGKGYIRPTGSNSISISGKVTPGVGVGNLVLDLGATSGGVTFQPGAKMEVELGTPGKGDALVFYNFGTGDLTLNNNAVDVVDAGGLAPGTYTIMTFYSGAGTGLTDTGKPGSGLKIGAGLSAYGSTKIDYSQLGKINLVISQAAGTLISIR